MSTLRNFVAEEGYVPLAWAGATMEMDYLNWGDALSPVMVALMCGLPIRRVPTRSHSLRLGAVGTVGHGFDLGEIYFWGTGTSEWRNPSAPLAERQAYAVTPGTEITVCATRGPYSADILGGVDVPYGDPVWLLPRFHNPKIEKTYDLGIILHLSELDGRALDAGPADWVKRAQIPPEFADRITIINTLTAIDPDALRTKTDEILACKRIVSTSLHGMVVAETYGIPCLYFGVRGQHPATRGLSSEPLDAPFLDARIRDLYQGIGRTLLPMYIQPRGEASDFAAIMDAIDTAWAPCDIDQEALIAAFPLDTQPLSFAPGESMWTHPAITGIQFQHDVGAVRREDAERVKAARVKVARAKAAQG